MNVYKYAKRHAENHLDLNLILDAHGGDITKGELRLLMVHWLSWYYHFSRRGSRGVAKENMSLFISELMLLPGAK